MGQHASACQCQQSGHWWQRARQQVKACTPSYDCNPWLPLELLRTLSALPLRSLLLHGLAAWETCMSRHRAHLRHGQRALLAFPPFVFVAPCRIACHTCARATRTSCHSVHSVSAPRVSHSLLAGRRAAACLVGTWAACAPTCTPLCASSLPTCSCSKRLVNHLALVCKGRPGAAQRAGRPGSRRLAPPR